MSVNVEAFCDILTSNVITRPADTTAYASGDLVANSTTAGSVTTDSAETSADRSAPPGASRPISVEPIVASAATDKSRSAKLLSYWFSEHITRWT